MKHLILTSALALTLAPAAFADQRATSCEKVAIPGTNAVACASSTITGTSWVPTENGADRDHDKAE
ncbi:hypothetical protein D1114_07195 [Cereibacter sphaeroides]|uniref:DUF680 domain-containing protein n=1 Tax=Cereibacter sphaeroides TaxID=1063 RepID=A0AAX1UNC3_CERSP|nr:hypothetical protein [Cereibacter sphaeroides]RHZ96487.1 hypothetical protein D1114_07195 [Cereibacter sphaeroides]